jgi:hypothetical protein
MALITAGALCGQYHPGGAPVVTGGFGNAVFPAGTPANSPNVTRFTPNAVFPAGGGPRLTIPGNGKQRYTGTGLGTGAVVVYPVYVGNDSFFDSYAQQPQQAQQQQPNITVVYPPQPAPVIVSQYGQGPAQHAGDNTEPVVVVPPQDQPDTQGAPPDHYLIAFRDHTVYMVVAYWVDGDTLHYFTAGNVHNQASMTLVDRDLTTRLNKEMGTEAKLQPGK